MIEEWKETEIKEVYISNLGNVKSETKHFYKFIFNGYNAIRIYNKTYYIHRLVAKAFIPNPQFKPCVNHINGIKTDNRIENLEWVTYSENNSHAYKTGLKQVNKKTKKHKSICMLNEEKDIICIFPKMKYVKIIINNKNIGNIIRAIKTGIKCCGYYWEYHYDNDINLKVNNK